ncbi:MAG TPA: hypothetical protein VFC23_17980, partial [Thermoanaerobaculia bacterium]|nr:hypothetical protein [Thermoanaerobaculia bacterium]
MKGTAVVLWGFAAAVGLSSSGSAQQTCPLNTGGAVLVTDATQVGALVPSGVPDTCAATAPCVAQGSQAVNYDAYTLVNNNTANPTCVTAKLTANCGVQGVTELYLAAYSPALNPASICQNYLGSSGMTAINSQVSASFRVPAGAPFQVVVSLPTGGQCEYTLAVSGCGAGDPQPPALIPTLSPLGLTALLLGLAVLGWRR